MVLTGETGVIGENATLFTKDPTWQHEIHVLCTIIQTPAKFVLALFPRDKADDAWRRLRTPIQCRG